MTDDTSASLQSNNDSQLLLSLPLLSSLSVPVARVASNDDENNSNPSSSGGDRSNNTTRHSKTKKRSR